MITLKQMEAFYWVGILGNLAAAAEKIHVAQSTISKRLIELEQALGVTLLDRELRSARLTLKGSEILPIAEKMLRVRDQVMAAANNRAAISGLLRIGVTELVAVTWLPDLIAAVNERYPLLVIEPVVDLMVKLYDSLEDRSVDLVIGPRAYKDDRFDYRLLEKVEQAWMCSPNLFAGDTALPLSEMKSFRLLMQPNGSGLQFMVNRLLDDNGVRSKSVITCNGMMALAEMAASGLGVACLPKFYFREEIEAGRLRIVYTTPPLSDLQYATATRRDAIGHIASEVADMAVETCSFNPSKRSVNSVKA